MIDHRCPRCSAKAFEASAPLNVIVEVRCKRCRQTVVPVPETGGIVIRSYRCDACHREQSCVDPVDDMSYCIPCGTPTLRIVGEHRPESAESAEHRTQGAWNSH